MAQRKKWCGSRIRERQELAAERRRIRKEPSSSMRRVLELTLSRKLINATILSKEPDLDKTCWVEYGYLSPLERTELFCSTYLKLFRHFYEKYRDYHAAAKQKPVDEELLANAPSEIVSLWRARQTADEIGMPYFSYLSEVMDRAAKRIDRKQLPRPNQLYNEKQVKFAREKWGRERQRATLFEEGWDDRFFQQNPKLSDPPRRRALQMALEKMKGASNPEYVLTSLMGYDDALSELAVKNMFRKQPELFEKALRHRSPPRVVRAAKTFDPYLPPCLGMRQDVSATPCDGCPYSLRCVRVRAMSDQLLQAQTGNSDPIAVKEREQARERQRRKRDRDRAALTEDSLPLEVGV